MNGLAWVPLACAVLTLGCGPIVSLEADTDAGSSSTSAETTDEGVGVGSSTPPNPVTGPSPTTGPITTTPPTATDPTFGTDGSSGLDSSGSWGVSSGSTGRSTVGGEFPDGADCSENFQCNSGECYVTGIGGICGECSDDSDCEFGCNVPNPLSSPPQGSTCSAGNPGENCDSPAGCDGGLDCVEVINVPGIIEISSCSECALDMDCQPGSVCNIDLAVADFNGVWTCTPAGSVPLGGTCDLQGSSGDVACASNICAEASIKGLISVGVCSECNASNPCGGGETCVEPDLGIDGTSVPGMCV